MACCVDRAVDALQQYLNLDGYECMKESTSSSNDSDLIVTQRRSSSISERFRALLDDREAVSSIVVPTNTKLAHHPPT